MKTRTALQIWLVALLLCSMALSSSLLAQRYHTRIYDYSSGLPTLDLSGITQDTRGDLWIASRTGLIHYDGLDWQLHQPRYSRGDAIEHCCTDPSGRLWTTSEGSVSWFAKGQWHDLPWPFEPSLRHTTDMVSMEIDEKSHLLLLSRRGFAALWDGRQWISVKLESSKDPVFLACAATSAPQAFWMSTEDALVRVDPRTGKATRVLEFGTGSPAYGIGYDASNEALWLVGTTWVGRMSLLLDQQDPAVLEILHADIDMEVALRLDRHIEVQDDGRGGVWFGNAFTIRHLVGGHKLRQVTRSNGLAAEGLTSLFKDREQNIWIISQRGMTKVINQRFENYDREQGLLHDEVTAVSALADGTIVLGHPGGLTLLDPAGTRTIRIEGTSPKSRVMDLSLDPDGRMWVACDYVGVGLLDLGEGLDQAGAGILWLPNPPNRRIYSICHDANGITWVGTTYGLYRIEGHKFIHAPLPAPASKNSSAVRRVRTSPDGGLLMATMSRGILKRKGKNYEPWSIEPEARSTFTFLTDSDGMIWGGSKSGLLILRGDQFRFSQHPRISRPVYGLLEDSRHNIWIGTDKGIYSWNGDGLRYFDVNKGLVGAEINRAALFEDSRQRIWIGTDRGVSCYDPMLDTRVACKPILTLKGVETSGTLHELKEPLSLASDSRDLVFRFSVSSFMDEDGVRFQTWLENFDQGWSTERRLPLNQVRYTNLPAGSYRFHIRATDVEGNRSMDITSSRLTIERPFYSQMWFLTLNAVLVLGLGWAGFLFLSQRRHAHDLETQIRLHTEKLRKAERTQAQIARLESLGALAGGIAHDFNNLLTAITGYTSLIGETSRLDDQASGFVSEVEKACARAKTLTRQLLTFSTGGMPIRAVASMHEIIQDAVSFAMLGSTLDCIIDIPDDLPAVNVDAGQFHQVFNNLIINARQAMPDGGTLRISARVLMDKPGAEQQIQINVADEGSGIPEDILDQIFDPYFTTKSEGSGLGLAIIHSIVTKHGGAVVAESNAGGGAVFRLTIPTATEAPLPRSASRDLLQVEPCRVLIMDDQSAIRHFVRSALEHRDCEVEEAENGDVAVSLYEDSLASDTPYCAVIMDLTIPGGMGGLRAAEIILAMDPRAQLIVTSGYANEPIMADHEAFGFVDRLGKPFAVKDLMEVLNHVQQRGAQVPKA